MGGGPWGDFTDYVVIWAWTLVGLVGLTIILDEGIHFLTHWLEHKGHSHHSFRPTKTGHNIYKFRMYLELLMKLKAELMVLGFLAFIVWTFNVGGVFPSIAAVYSSSPAQGSGSISSGCGSG
eukprot:632084-Prymnesium_polylepis.1